jgi:hypothetical protein
MGLGSASAITLKQARKLANEARELLSGVEPVDPITARRHHRDRLKAEATKRITFEEAAAKYIAAHESEWSNARGNGVTPASCPFFPSKQTFVSASGTSAKCHERTLAARLLSATSGSAPLACCEQSAKWL